MRRTRPLRADDFGPRRPRPALLALAAAAACLAGPAAAAGTTQVVARTGDPAPAGGGAFDAFDFPSINNAGQVAFDAGLSGTPVTASEGLFRSGGDVTTQFAREGSAAPGGNGTFSSFSFSPPTFNDAGQVAFHSVLINTSGGTTDNTGVYRADGAAVITIAREGQVAPGGNGTFSVLAGQPSLNASGQVGFRATLTGTSGGTADDVGLFRGDGAAPVTIAREGGSTGLAGEAFSALTDVGELNDAGQVAFRGVFNGGTGVFRGDGGTLVHVARSGQAAPGTAGTFASFSSAGLNGTGQAVFVAGINGVSGAAATGVFRGDGTSLVPVALGGQAVPGGGTFAQFTETPDLNDAGAAAFRAFVAGDPHAAGGVGTGIFRAGDGGLLRIASEGAATPGGTRVFETLLDPVINNAGQVAFAAVLDGGRGVYLYDDVAGLIEIAKTGDVLLGSTISDVAFSGLPRNDAASGLNELGQVAFAARLDDGRYVVAVYSVPEPAAAPLIALVAARLLRRTRRAYQPAAV